MTDFDSFRRDWLSHLSAERRLSPKTLEAYARDLGQFHAFHQHVHLVITVLSGSDDI